MNHNEDLEVIEDVLTRKEEILDPMKDVSLILAIYGLSEVSAIRQKLSRIYQPNSISPTSIPLFKLPYLISDLVFYTLKY